VGQRGALQRRLQEISRAAGSDWALGVEARSRALLSNGDAAERLHLEAIERLGRTRIRVALARAHLLHGEWLRRQGRRMDAREQLYSSMGMEGFISARTVYQLRKVFTKLDISSRAQLDGVLPRDPATARPR